MKTEELKPCPFCGSEAAFRNDDDSGHWIECTNAACGVCTNIRVALMDDVRPMLADQWNNRATPAGVTAPTEGALDPREGMCGLHPYEFWIGGVSLRWYLKREVDPLLAKLTATSPPVGQDDARDAARYRWLRNTAGSQQGPEVWVDGDYHLGRYMDAAIDAAMSTAPASEPVRMSLREASENASAIVAAWPEWKQSNEAPASEPVTAKCDRCGGAGHEPGAPNYSCHRCDGLYNGTGTAPTKAEPVTPKHQRFDNFISEQPLGVRAETVPAGSIGAEPATSEGGRDIAADGLADGSPWHCHLWDLITKWSDARQGEDAMAIGDEVDAHIDARIAAASQASYRNGFEQGRSYGEMGAAQAGSELPKLPRVWGITRDINSPGQKAVWIAFDRALTDDELRALHDALAKQSREGGV